MAYIFTSGPHVSPQFGSPPLSQKQINTGTWGTGGNTCVITDPYIHPSSSIHIWVTGTTPMVGNWSITVSQGSATITSTDAESSTLPVSYIVL